MNVIDIIILLCCVPALYNGITKGFISQAFSLVALVLGAWFSFKFAGPLGEWLKSYADLPGPILNVIAFALILVIVVMVLKMTAMTLERLLKVVMLGWLDKLLGVVYSFRLIGHFERIDSLPSDKRHCQHYFPLLEGIDIQ